MQYIPKAELKHGAYYKGTCRNANVARWNAERDVFVHWEYGFGTFDLAEIACPEDDLVHDVFYANEEVEPDKEIPFY